MKTLSYHTTPKCKIDGYSNTARALKLPAIAACTLLLAACGSDNNNGNNSNVSSTPAQQLTIFDIAADDERFDSLELALTTTGLDAALDNPDATYTVFAPTDDAFEKLGETLNTLLSDPDTLSNILQYHVIDGATVNANTAVGLAGNTQEMLNKNNIAITLQGDDLYINNAKVIITDIAASNGIIHAIDTVITPPAPINIDGTIIDAAVTTPELSTLVSAIEAAGLVDLLSDESKMFTVFAPLDSAFDKIDDDALSALLADNEALTDVLTYHVISDSDVDSITALSLSGKMVTMANGDDIHIMMKNGKLFINHSEVVTKDIVTKNGTVHLIDTVLMPPVGSITDIAAADERFETLVTALKATELDKVLADKSKVFTVFAPTDDAFDKLGEETINALLADTDTLSNILLYHVVPDANVNAKAALATAAAGETVTTVNGGDISLTVVDGELYINNSKVIINDIMADNGIIHVVDTVIVPPKNIYQTAIDADVFGVLSEALIAAGVDEEKANAEATKIVFEATELTTVLSDETAIYTLFVPTAEAFSALGNEVLNDLAENPEKLKDILLYHTVAGAKLNAADAITAGSTEGGTDITMANAAGNTAKIELIDEMLYVNDAKVVTTNIQASNGIIHFIDKVTLPAAQ
ncbi:fasciclin domain-containing protein [Marinagarivorans algicola]|uniref:fasciclin domain-containing protein n=1 Tax=Marinagarivorans algicola TaxID=1513270 RepID=UPI000A56A389|nr:fasciclin domain-containing protein [Marinagarivorans algicola]